MSSASPPLDEQITAALGAIRAGITVEPEVVATHQVALVLGLDAAALRRPIATYIVAAGVAQAVRTNLQIATDLLGSGPTFEESLRRDVIRRIGTDNAISDDFRQDERDPWIVECLAHLFMYLSRDLPALGPPGELRALTPPHTDVKDHGLDLVGIHLEQAALLGLTIAEAKTSENSASGHATDAASLFASIDSGHRESEIRGTIQLLREGLLPEYQEMITPLFWQDRRAYLPTIGHSAASTFSPMHQRPTYGSLSPGPTRVKLISVSLTNYRAFFDAIADEMRALVPSTAGLSPGTGA